MADFDAAGLAKIAQGLIDKYGTPCTLLTFPKPPANTTTPWKPQDAAAVPVATSARFIVLPKTREREAPMRYADGTLQRIGDENVYLGPLAPTAPDVGSVVVKPDGSRWTFKTVSPLAPNGVVLLYEGWIQK